MRLHRFWRLARRRTLAGPVTTLALLAAALSAATLPVRAQDIPPGTPPDVAKILRKMKSGQPPSAADIQRLQEWSQQLQNHLNVPGAGTNGSQFSPASQQKRLPQGIPCRIEATIDYTATSTGQKIHLQMNAWTKAVLFPSINGTGDYNLNMLNPAAPVSSFRFEPYAPGGKAAAAGGGSMMRVAQYGQDTTTSHLIFTHSGCSMMLVTSGTDALYPEGGSGVGGVGDGTITSGSSTRPLHDSADTREVLSVPFVLEANQKAEGGHPTPSPAMPLSLKEMIAAVRASTPTTLSTSEAFDFTNKTGDHVVGKSTLRITLRPTSLELRIEPGDEAAYEQWLPLPDPQDSGAGDTAALFGKAKPLIVHTAIVDTAKAAPAAGAAGGPTQPNAQLGGQIDLYLRKVSTHKGLCMNYPKDAAGPRPGLFFPRAQPAGIDYVDEQHVRTHSTSAVEATVRVAARDTGAYGVVHAECAALGLESQNVRTGKQSLIVPMDDDENHLPDAWEKKEGIHGLPATWDEEAQPAGMKSKGDGLTLFEEYRGFLVEAADGSETFQRLSPKRRKLFLFPTGPDKALYKQGGALYGQITGLDIVCLHDADRMQPYGDTPYANWINFNETEFSKTLQRAIWVGDFLKKDPQPGSTINLDDYSEVYPQYPSTTKFVTVSRAACLNQVTSWQKLLPPVKLPVEVPADFQSAAAAHGIDLAAVGKSLPSRVGTLADELVVFCTVHELGHATGGRHHRVEDYVHSSSLGKAGDDKEPDRIADPDADAMEAMFYSSGDHACPMRYWHFDKDKTETLLFLSGQWDLTRPASGGQWKFCTDDWRNMAIKE